MHRIGPIAWDIMHAVPRHVMNAVVHRKQMPASLPARAGQHTPQQPPTWQEKEGRCCSETYSRSSMMGTLSCSWARE